MKKTFFSATIAALMTVSASAHADSFARSYMDVTNLVITESAGISNLGSVNTSITSACLNGNSNCVNNGGPSFLDSPVSTINYPGYVNNSYTTNESYNASSYLVADASIDKRQLAGDGYTQARSMAEGKAILWENGNANASNSSATTIKSTFTVAQGGGTIDFAFDAATLLKAALSQNSINNAFAEANMSLSFSISNNLGQTVFTWAPDGQIGNITGGVETRDAFTLNQSVAALVGNNGPLVYDPSAICSIGGVGGCFAAHTNTLNAGIYTLNLSMKNGINLVSAVPEPETYGMLLAGLAFVGFVARRKKQA